MTRAVTFACLAALVVFAVVQDRLTAAGVARYVILQREALAGRRPPVRIDDVMTPAINDGVRQGALWGGVVLATGLGGIYVARRRRRRE